ncbi:MAG: hypothetical protein CK533_04620 [Acidobacterium sp.]|nr:hypothetical protein [Acidobacteriota bacterium]PHY11530.1 MAG: hypothetical protein CK533_04620 [Acidobacterium sp.]
MRIVGLTLTAALLGFVAAGAQAPAAKPATMLRTSDGRLSLQGNWTNATITPFERQGTNRPLVLSEAQALDEETKTQDALDAREAPTSADRGAPPVGGEPRPIPPDQLPYLERLWQGGGGLVGGYNTFWVDPGDRVLRVDGQPRSSIVIDPPNGLLPSYTKAAQDRFAAAAAIRSLQGGEYDHPELRPRAERCVTSFGNNLGPPMLPNYFYNNNYTIVQTKDNVMILTEMVHDARVVRMGGTHPPASFRQWFGDSIGRWDGDTLVIETTNFHPNHGFRGSWENLKVTERITRKDAGTLSYRFIVEDSTTFTGPFSGALEFRAMAPDEQVYEYACHEANYGLEGVLSGARAQEREAAMKKSKQ